MKNVMIFPAAFILICVFSTLSTCTVTAQTSIKRKFTSAADTVTNESPSFTARIVPDENNTEKFILFINNPFNQRLTISIRSGAGEGFIETTTQATFAKRFDMSGAQDGMYTITVNNGRTTLTKQLQLATKTEVTRSIAIR